MVASLIEAFGNINPYCDSCSSRQNVVDWDEWNQDSSIGPTKDKCNKTIFFSEKYGSYQNGYINNNNQCTPGAHDDCLIGTVVSSCREANQGGSLEKPLCIGNLVGNFKDNNNNNLCNVSDKDASNYYFTQTDTQPGQEKYNICDKWGITGSYWKVGDECQFKKPSNNPPPSASCSSALKTMCQKNNCCN